MATIIKVNGDKIEVSKEQKLDLEFMQSVVGGYIERISLFDGRAMYINEEGKMKGLPKNDQATFLADLSGISPDDCVVGDVIILTEEEES